MRLSFPVFRRLSRTPSVSPEPPPSPDLRRLNRQRLSEDARVLTVLGSACTLGAVVGGLGARACGRVRTRAFFQAALGTHLFVLGTVLVGARAVRAQALPRLGLRTSLRRGRVLQRLLGVGLGLDGASMALGAALLLRRRGAAWHEGAGASFLLHGIALLVFDAGVFRRNALHQQRVEALSRTSSGQAVVTKSVLPLSFPTLALGNLEGTALI
jgi:hypothetical protein